MHTYDVDIRFTVEFLNPDDMAGDGISRIGQRALGQVEAKSKHDVWRNFKRQMNARWPVRWSHKIRSARIVRVEV